MAGSRIIFHIDVNSAFLSWEAVYRLRCGQEGPDLRSVPSAVGGDMAMRHGVIKYTDVVEQYSIDEAFMDMTGTEKLFGSP